MFDHLSIGVRDMARSGAFYDAALKPLGHTRLYEGEYGIGYGTKHPQFWIDRTDSPVPSDPKSCLHICFRADSRAAVDAFHALAIQNGGTDNGPPGLRPQYTPTYYAAFVIDPDGYRIEAVCYTPD
ncbi:VOC family protein [Ferrovibrio terrae]|uniref:VOC family protein n=1 Tax=Ferrovibrio terrae TaxID=2594003 RepID=A0A516H2T5_9PROT|nr:VOC family protein [Ferrovibrio terrae]QDO98055.1 VOC family protein [Ferrovibrio terrae]